MNNTTQNYNAVHEKVGQLDPSYPFNEQLTHTIIDSISLEKRRAV
jgi:hypothetical protein